MKQINHERVLFKRSSGLFEGFGDFLAAGDGEDLGKTIVATFGGDFTALKFPPDRVVYYELDCFGRDGGGGRFRPGK